MALFGKRYHPAGTSPGTLTKERSADAIPFRIRLVDFDADEIAISDDVTPEDCEPYLHRETTTWIHVSGHPRGNDVEGAWHVFWTAFAGA